jgi:TQXA domain-containing protein
LSSLYENQYGVIRDVTNKELDAYTDLPSDGSLYPPNDNGFTPVKEGSDTSTIRDNVARVLYYGYPNDALNLMENYDFAAQLTKRQAFTFEVATQCAIWHYTDGIDFSTIKDLQQDDPRVTHVKQIYSSISAGFTWGWVDVQNLYNFLIGNDAELVHTVFGTGGKFDVDYPLSTSAKVSDDFAVDLFVVDNPVNVNNADSWTQNLVTAGTASTTDVSITKIWDDQSNADGNRPDADAFADWIHLYNGTTDVTETYADYLTVTDNGNNTYTVTYSGLPVSGYSYTIQEVIPDEYSDYYKLPDETISAESGGSIANYAPVEETQNSSLTIKKTDSDGNVLEGAKFTLYSDANCTTAITDVDAIDASSGTVAISTSASYLQNYLPTANGGTATVYLQETTAPTGYAVSSTVYPITLKTVIEEGWNEDNTEYTVTTSYTITSSGSVVLTVQNTPATDTAVAYEKLTITKVSDSGTALEGAVFTLYSDAACTSAVAVLDVTGSAGTVVIDTENLPTGLTNPTSGSATYYLKETTAPNGYTASDTVYTIVLGTSVSSAWNSDNTAYVTTTTHTIRCNGSNALRVSNTSSSSTKKHSELTIYKTDEDTGDALAGATFELYADEGCTDLITTSDSDVITTDSNGQAYINTSASYLEDYLPTEDGSTTVYLKETSAPTGYELSDTVYSITITSSTSDGITTYTIAYDGSSTLSVVNTPNTSSTTVNSELTVYKVDETQQPLEGAVFTLYSDADCTSAITALTATGSDGTVTISTEDLADYLPDAGSTSYVYLKETTAPTGYALKDTVYTLTLGAKVTTAWNSDNTSKVTTTTYTITSDSSDSITVVDQPVVDLTVYKSWSSDLADLTSPVTVRLTENGTETDQTLTLNEGNSWTATFEDLSKYDSNGSEITYGVIEVDGSKYYDVTYTENSDGSITVTNSAKSIHTTVAVDGNKSHPNQALTLDYSQLGDDYTVNVIDTVSYTGLDTETTYTVVGRLMDVTDEDNAEIIAQASEVVTPTAADGTVDVDFGDVILEEGHKYVVYEYLYAGELTDQSTNDENKELPDETPIAEHEDNDDTSQTFVTVGIHTTVAVDETSSSSSQALTVDYSQLNNGSANVVDTVTYTGLDTTKTYTVVGRLMDVTDEDNEEIIDQASTEFTTTTADGTVEVDFGEVTLEAGHKYVVYEYLYTGEIPEQPTNDENHELPEDETPTAEHEDNDDNSQTFITVEIHTTVVVDETSSSSDEALTVDYSQLSDGQASVVDTVTYTGLDTSTTYTVVGQLWDLTDGEIIDQASAEFTPTASDGTVDVDFGDVTLEAGHKYVVYEYLYTGTITDESTNDENHELPDDETPIAEHEDSNDNSQTFVTAEIQTTVAVDGTPSSSDEALAVDYSQLSNGSANVVDTISYTGLDTTKTYTVVGRLMDVTDEDNEVIIDQASTEFTPTDSDGTVEVDFGDVTLEAGHKYVVYEYLYTGEIPDQPTNDENHELPDDETPTAEHEDSDDNSQTFVTVEIHTTVGVDGVKSTSENELNVDYSKLTEDHTGQVVDTISYTGLDTSKTYTVFGLLMDITDESNETVVAQGSTVFQPAASDGSVDVDFGEVALEAGHKYVVYEYLYTGEIPDQPGNELPEDETPTAEHHDNHDKSQSFVTVDIHTTVAVDGTQSTSENELSVNYSGLTGDHTAQVVDTVTYTGLDTSKTYTVVGRLMDITDESNETIVAQSSTVFQPASADGTVDVDFGDVALEAGHRYVVYEYLYTGEIPDQPTNDENHELPEDETPTAEHHDSHDKAQTFVTTPEAEIYTTVGVDGTKSTSENELVVDYANLTEDHTGHVVDTVTYTGLDTSKTYTVVGRLVDITDENSETIVAQSSTVFQPASADGTVDVDFGDVALEAGHRYVVYEYLYTGEIPNQPENDKNHELPKDETPTAEHHDKHDKSQTFVTMEYIDLPVYKEWAEGLKEEAVTVQLLRNGEAVEGATATLSADNNWYYRFENLPKYDLYGNEYTYSVEETGGKWVYVLTVNSDGSITITNTAKASVGVPDTGDRSTIAAYLLLMIVAAAGILVLVFRKRRAK